jgi:hypothetical protein
MNRQAIFYPALGGSALAVFLIPFCESALNATLASLFTCVAAIGIITFISLAVPIFYREKSNGTNLAMCLLIAGFPFAVVLLLPLFRQELNVHGLSLITWFAYAALSELCAVSLLIALLVRTVKKKAQLPL